MSSHGEGQISERLAGRSRLRDVLGSVNWPAARRRSISRGDYLEPSSVAGAAGISFDTVVASTPVAESADALA